VNDEVAAQLNVIQWTRCYAKVVECATSEERFVENLLQFHVIL